jgi:hypothetical protein
LVVANNLKSLEVSRRSRRVVANNLKSLEVSRRSRRLVANNLKSLEVSTGGGAQGCIQHSQVLGGENTEGVVGL